MNKNISKRNLCQYVNIKTKRSIHHYHVFSVINILFEEMYNDLVAGKEIKIFNFGTFVLKILAPRRYHHLTLKKMMISDGGSKILRLFLDRKINKKLIQFLDIDKKSEND